MKLSFKLSFRAH